MKNNLYRSKRYWTHTASLCLLIFCLPGCKQKKNELLWTQSLYQIGSQSSPRATDINGDDILDIIMGAGKGEIDDTDHGVIALDGKTGELLWSQATNAHMVGSPTFVDINQDGTEDVIVGGRERELHALDGKTGNKRWSYEYQYEDDPTLTYARFNFYNSSLVPDQNGDGIQELLIINGGNWKAAPYETEDRFPGVLMLFDPVDGSILAADTMPDGKESYMSPISYALASSPSPYIIFGTGGETVPGNLYLTTLNQLMQGTLEQATIIASETEHGFIAPPSLADINDDGMVDILAISHASTIFAIDGKDQTLIWQQSFPGTESSNSFAMGQFTGDPTPDVLAILSKGVWPNYTKALQIVLDGTDGSIAYQDSMACFGLSSPVVYDLDHDGYDEAILSQNEYDCSLTVEVEDSIDIQINHSLVYLDLQTNKLGTIDQSEGFKNVYSTPWIGELDQDGYLDIVYPIYFHPGQINRFLGMKIKRISTAIPVKEKVLWGAYMGSQGNGAMD